MKVKRFVFNMDSLKMEASRISAGRVLLGLLKYIFISAVIAVFYYLIIALVFDTPNEAKLKSDNRQMAAAIGKMHKNLLLLERETEGLRARDAKLYHDIFDTDPPAYLMYAADSAGFDMSSVASASEERLIREANAGIGRMCRRTDIITESLREVSSMLSSGSANSSAIPSIVPLQNFALTCTGASTGQKFNPFFKTILRHEGLDLMASYGAPVLSTADGTVVSVEKRERGFGNRVVIAHSDDILTTYSHLSEVGVREGQTVRRGSVIGKVGTSGRTFAPHLHYEVIRDGVCQDPVLYLFGELSEKTYREMLIMAHTTGQSMD